MTTRQSLSAELSDETLISQITIQPDGRVYVFGASREVLEVLEAVNPVDRRVALLLRRVRETREKR
jgi:hypothetical protein